MREGELALARNSLARPMTLAAETKESGDMTAKTYTIRAAAGQPAEVWIYGDIGESWWGESVEAKTFVRELAAIDAAEIFVRINSYGGSVSDGLAIYNALKRHPASIRVSVDGVAVSIASLIAMAGDTVEMAENALFMVHAPWGGAVGNAQDMRAYADLLDKYAESMVASYAAKTGRDTAELLALLTDGEDHWYSADEAREMGFVDEVVSALPIAASFDLSRFRKIPAAAAAFSQEKFMTKRTAPVEPSTPATDVAQPTQPDNAQPVDAAAIREQVLAAERTRRDDIARTFKGFATREGVSALMSACQDDPHCSLDQAREKLIAHLGREEQAPIAGHYAVTVEDEADKIRAAQVQAIMARAGARDRDGNRVVVGTDNPFRGRRLVDLARASVERAGRRTDGMDSMEIVGLALSQTTSDFPILLETTMHKTLLAAYATQPDTWSRFCKIGSVSDFRAHPRYRVGSLANIKLVPEGAEYEHQDIPDGTKVTAQAQTKGSIISVTRQMIINDDLGAFLDLANMLGRAARRTIEADVYALLALNSGMGPTMGDTKALFHTDHGNVAADGVLSVDVIDSMRSKMALQKDISGNEYLDLRPAVIVTPTGSGGLARVINDAQYDPDTANKLQRPNMVRGLFRDVVDTPRLSGVRVYAFADPAEAPVIEVVFLDGNQEPKLEVKDAFTRDGASWKVRLDYGVGALDWRGAVTAKGAT